MTVCPVCGSDAHRPVAPQGARMTFAKDRRCGQCGTVWRLPCPMWAGWLSVLLGVGLLGVGVWLALGLGVTDARKHWEPVWLIASTGGVVLSYGFAVVTGKAGRLEIITPGSEGEDAS
jgi:hypothetical protein